ncbi:Hypothetical_protein [Hexamita inflata]|uniref:Hypothetical_protein n=1 Tax=Hexamita inflata TaxID=28002 RepID=A0AA86UZX6_9EUKA|nr:Hypothetical protein HINF_LOCUS58591 [Hexamita inflata]
MDVSSIIELNDDNVIIIEQGPSQSCKQSYENKCNKELEAYQLENEQLVRINELLQEQLRALQVAVQTHSDSIGTLNSHFEQTQQELTAQLQLEQSSELVLKQNLSQLEVQNFVLKQNHDDLLQQIQQRQLSIKSVSKELTFEQNQLNNQEQKLLSLRKTTNDLSLKLLNKTDTEKANKQKQVLNEVRDRFGWVQAAVVTVGLVLVVVAGQKV